MPVDPTARRILSQGKITLENDIAAKGPGRDLWDGEEPRLEEGFCDDLGEGLLAPGDLREGGLEASLEARHTGLPGLLRVAAHRPVSLASYLQGTLDMQGRGQQRLQCPGRGLAILDVQGEGCVPAPGILVSLHPGPVEQRKAAMRRFDGQGV